MSYMLPPSLCFVDVETTGTSVSFDHIIEIAIIRVEQNKVVDQFSSLINPQTSLDPFIEKLTGITSSDLKKAPSFYEKKHGRFPDRSL